MGLASMLDMVIAAVVHYDERVGYCCDRVPQVTFDHLHLGWTLQNPPQPSQSVNARHRVHRATEAMAGGFELSRKVNQISHFNLVPQLNQTCLRIMSAVHKDIAKTTPHQFVPLTNFVVSPHKMPHCLVWAKVRNSVFLMSTGQPTVNDNSNTLSIRSLPVGKIIMLTSMRTYCEPHHAWQPFSPQGAKAYDGIQLTCSTNEGQSLARASVSVVEK